MTEKTGIINHHQIKSEAIAGVLANHEAVAKAIIGKIIPPAFKGGWDTWDEHSDEATILKTKGLAWVQQLRREPQKVKGLRLGGVPGSGKTHVGYAVIADLINSGLYNVGAENMHTICRAITQTWSDKTSHIRDVERMILEREVFFLDDVGSESNKVGAANYVQDFLYGILNHSSAHGKPLLIISSNLNMEEIADHYEGSNGERMVSRLAGITEPLAEFPEVDYRERAHHEDN